MANLTHIWPCFIVEDIKPSLSFYVDKLGFEVQFIAPDDDPFFAIVGRENVSIMLKAVAADVKPAPNGPRHAWSPWDAYISAAEPGVLFEEYQSRGVTFRQPLKVNGDRLLGFEVADDNGYVLFFGRPE